MNYDEGDAQFSFSPYPIPQLNSEREFVKKNRDAEIKRRLNNPVADYIPPWEKKINSAHVRDIEYYSKYNKIATPISPICGKCQSDCNQTAEMGGESFENGGISVWDKLIFMFVIICIARTLFDFANFLSMPALSAAGTPLPLVVQPVFTPPPVV